MDSISIVQDLINAVQTPTDHKTPAADGNLAGFEKAIDRIVADQNQASKTVAQASLQKAKVQAEKLAEHAQERAFLESQVQQAEVAVAALEGNQPNVQQTNQLLGFKRQEVAYWEGKLRQLSPPCDGNDPLSILLGP